MMQYSYSREISAPLKFSVSWPAFDGPRTRDEYESEQAKLLLANNGLDSIDALFSLIESPSQHRKGRFVSRLSLRQPSGKSTETFVKFNWGFRRMVPRVADLRARQLYYSHPEREWDGIEALRSIGLFVPERIAILKRGTFWFQDAIVIKRVHPEYSLDELIRNGTWNRYSSDQRQVLLEAVVHVMQRIHQAGLGWRGTCTRHFFPNQIAGGLCQLWLIDCEGVHRGVDRRCIARDFRKLRKAFEISGAPEGTLRQLQLLSDKSQASHIRQVVYKPRLFLAALKPSA